MDIPHVTVEQMRRVDELVPGHFGIDILQLMENAGRSVAMQAREMVGTRGKIITIMCGKGHNGGDGLVAARFLSAWGATVYIMLPSHPDELKSLVKDHYGTARSMHLNRMTGVDAMQWERAMKESHLVIDALLGYSLNGDPRGNYADLIHLANRSGKKILAVDTPSGLDSQTGKARDPCIKATQTLALALPKQGLFQEDGPRHAGKVFVADIGVPHEVYDLLGMRVPHLFEKKSIIKV